MRLAGYDGLLRRVVRAWPASCGRSDLCHYPLRASPMSASTTTCDLRMAVAYHGDPARFRDVADAAGHAARLGAGGIDLCWYAGDTSRGAEDIWREAGETVKRAGLCVSGVRVCGTLEAPVPRGPSAGHLNGHEPLEAAFAAAATCAARLVVVGANTLYGMSGAPRRHADRLAAILARLMGIRFAAAHHGITLAIDPDDVGLLPTPTEARRFLDEVNSPHVGVELDISRTTQRADPADWLLTLTHRIACIRVGEPEILGEAEGTAAAGAGRHAIRDALRRIRYKGMIHVTAPCETPAAAETAARVRRLLAD